MSRRFAIVAAVALMGCPDSPSGGTDAGPAPDAAPADAGSLDAGPANGDVGVHQPCTEQCREQCRLDRCIPGPARDCAIDSDCAAGESCSELGLCHGGQCISHGDCEADKRCANGRCVGRPNPAAGVVFERVHLPALDAHNSNIVIGDNMMPHHGFAGIMGFGGALFDIDGDLDLDLYVGSQGASVEGSPPCVYRNDSVPGRPAFSPIDELCDGRDGDVFGGSGLDIENDGFHELIVLKPTTAILRRFLPEPSDVELLDLLPPGDNRRFCAPGAAVSYDVDMDGLPDILLGCSLGEAPDANNPLDNASYTNLLFLQNEDHSFRYVSPEAWGHPDSPLLEAYGITLAIGAADIDHDGLIDLQIMEDSGVLGPISDPGGVMRRCPPGAGCAFEPWRLQPSGPRKFGSYMGSGLLQIDGLGEHLYVTDELSNRMVRFEDGAAVDVAPSTETELARMGAVTIFSWSVMVDDYDRDGRDDMFITNGTTEGNDIQAYLAHFDALFLQQQGQRFNLHSGDLGISPLSYEDSLTDQRPYASRAAVKADLDGDGFIDLLGFGLEGRPRWHREVPTQSQHPARCTIVPVDRYSPGFGIGHALIPEGDERPRQWDSQGQIRSGASPFVLTPWRRGRLRFPSGFEQPFDCGDSSRPVVLHEPDWMNLAAADGQWRLRLPEGHSETAPQLFHEASGELVTMVQDGEHWVSPMAPGEGRVMLRFGQRWMPRWWTP